MFIKLNKKKILLGLGALAVGVLLFLLWSVLPVLSDHPTFASTRVLARDGSLLYEVARPAEGLRTPVPLARMSPTLKDAVVLTEDARFFNHHGVDVTALARAVKDDVLAGRRVSGASTIEQQLIKNVFFFQRPRTFLQKIREMVAAVFWSSTHSKEETLERYLNTIPFGNQTFGVQAAAQRYVHKDVADLSVGDSALLAGIIAAPSAYDPYLHQGAARTRQRFVLDNLLSKQRITSEEHDHAAADALALFSSRHAIVAPFFVFRVLAEVEKQIPDVEQGGYVIKTTLDPVLQQATEASIERRLIDLADQGVQNAAAMAADARTGQVLAYVGNVNYFSQTPGNRIDMAAAPRQPGSALKPFLYFAAFLRGYTPATIIADTPVRFETVDGKPYYPRNYSHAYYGPVPLREALGSSLNIPAVKLLNAIGLPTFMATLAQFGLMFPEPADHYGLGLVLGGGEVTLYDAVQAYSILARQGEKVPFTTVLQIQDHRGRTIIDHSAPPKTRALFLDAPKAQQAIALVTDVLSDPAARSRAFREGSLLDVSRGVAVKTGTTKDFHDNWAFGYGSDFVAGVWVGNADQTPMQGVSGVTGAVPIWSDIMHAYYGHAIPKAFSHPPELVERDVCATSGLLANGICPKTRHELFIAGTEPTKQDDWYVRCGNQTYLHPPAEYAAWMTNARSAFVPSESCSGSRDDGARDALTILAPLDGDVYEIDRQVASEYQGIPFMAGGGQGQAYHWLLNGQKIDTSDPSFIWFPRPGEYVLTLQGVDRQVRFRVQ